MRPGRAIFVTGTDTGVGKTELSCLLLRAANWHGHLAIGMKPVETGAAEPMATGSDAWRLAQASEHDPQQLSVVLRKNIVPYSFSQPVSPHLAARMSNVGIDTTRIACAFHALVEAYSHVVVEGAGGILTPISENRSFLDLVNELELPVMIVARASLGTLNHTLLTVRVLSDAGVKIIGIAVNEHFSDDSLASSTSCEELTALSGYPVLRFPALTAEGPPREFLDQLFDLAFEGPSGPISSNYGADELSRDLDGAAKG